MEALWVQLDNLKWEVNRLDVENRQLREADTEASKLVDLQADLEQSKAEVAALTQRVRAYEEQLRRDGGCTEEEIHSGEVDCGTDPTFSLTSTGAEGECGRLRPKAKEAPHESVCGCYMCERRSRESGPDHPGQPVRIRPTTRATGKDRGNRRKHG